MRKTWTASADHKIIYLNNLRNHATRFTVNKKRDLGLIARTLPSCILTRKLYQEEKTAELVDSTLNFVKEELQLLEKKLNENTVVLMKTQLVSSMTDLMLKSPIRTDINKFLRELERKINNRLGAYFKTKAALTIEPDDSIFNINDLQIIENYRREVAATALISDIMAKSCNKAWDKSLNQLFVGKFVKKALGKFKWHDRLMDDALNPSQEKERYRQEFKNLSRGIFANIIHALESSLKKQIVALIVDLHDQVFTSRYDLLYREVTGHNRNVQIPLQELEDMIV